MVANNPAYSPPTSPEILKAQDEFDNLRLLLAQRRLYSRAKGWAFLRTIGLGVVAVLAPIVTAISPNLSVLAAAVAGLWIVVSRTLFLGLEKHYAERGAVIQEMFDSQIFGMPALTARDVQIMPEEIARLVGPESSARKAIKAQALNGWYPLGKHLDGADSIAIAQRANAAYSERLLWWNATAWLVITILWAAIALVLVIAFNFSVVNALLGVALPILPALLDTFDQWRRVRSAGRERRALADQIADELKDPSKPHVDPELLLVWQEKLFGLRKDAPQIPDLIYWALRKRNERVMSDVAAELSKAVQNKRTTP